MKTKTQLEKSRRSHVRPASMTSYDARHADGSSSHFATRTRPPYAYDEDVGCTTLTLRGPQEEGGYEYAAYQHGATPEEQGEIFGPGVMTEVD